MAKEKVKQWVILVVVALWLLTTLSACVSPPVHLKEKIVDTLSNKCPDELWGAWGKGPDQFHSHSMVFSHSIDGSGVESVTKDPSEGYKYSYVVDNKKHPFLPNNKRSRAAYIYYYSARCDLKTAQSGYQVFRITYFDKQGSPQYMYDHFVGRNRSLYTQDYLRKGDKLMKGPRGLVGRRRVK